MPPGLFDYDHPGDAPFGQGERFLADLSADDWAQLESWMERRRFPAGTALVRAGETGRYLLILVAGEVEVVADGRRGRRRLATLGAGAVIGEMAFFDGRPRSADVTATTPVDVQVLTRERFDQLAAWRPALALAVSMDLGRALSARLRRVNGDG